MRFYAVAWMRRRARRLATRPQTMFVPRQRGLLEHRAKAFGAFGGRFFGGGGGGAGGAGAASATGVAVAGAALLGKYGVKWRSLDKTNIMTAETQAQRMVSKRVLQVKHAANMNFMETVRHFTFLLSEKNLILTQSLL